MDFLVYRATYKPTQHRLESLCYKRKGKFMRSILLALSIAVCATAQQQSGVGVRILLGITDQQSTKWDGSVTVSGAEVRAIEPWRFEPEDSISGTSWKVATHAARLFNNGSQMGLVGPQFVPN